VESYIEVYCIIIIFVH